VLLALALSGCALASGRPKTVQVTRQDQGRTVNAVRGGTLVVILEGNPTTGYVWSLESGDDAVLPLQGDYAFTPDSTLAGAGGKLTFTFVASSPGQATLVFAYRRPWEPRDPKAETFTVTVNVK
jgi:inhibitor of cysteine peptidase